MMGSNKTALSFLYISDILPGGHLTVQRLALMLMQSLFINVSNRMLVRYLVHANFDQSHP